ncbi:phytoene desaturase family protein [Kitasatospora viridis]|uniref:Phytoene dehydrogenase-like protein n=1 Tax=Kitasatospora viridis TaxID=281105 RepID=A0A561UM44_9ACTN|nr:NAD(P)/FAD-dependent oxidoreductase [Kitasatospora viridis]TWG00446.1 phytoene dehydrogenase-like protein [Kitasatospora viridis]
MARIVIIGAGISGLAAAARLGTLGHRVTVCEAAPGPGGMVGRLQRDGFSFDTGPTLLSLPAVYRDLALKTGKEPLEQLVGLTPVDPESHHLFADGTALTLPNASRGGVARALDGALGAGAGERWAAVMNRGRAVWEATRRPLLEEPLPADTAPLGTDPYPAPRHGLARLLGGRARPTLIEVAERELGGDPRLTALLTECALRFGLDPRRAPAGATVLPYVEQTFGVWAVRGGLRTLVDVLVARCEQRGVEFRYGARVSPEDFPDAELVLRPEPAAAALPGRFSVLLALRGPRPAGTPQRTVVHTPRPREEFAALFDAPAPHELPTVQVLRPDDPSAVPDERHETAVLTCTVPSQAEVDWTAPGVAEAFADRMLARLHAAGLDLGDRVLWRQLRTPADTERETLSPGGAVASPALAGLGGAFLQPANETGEPGRYRLGQAAHPGGGLARAGMSACVVAGLVGPA